MMHLQKISRLLVGFLAALLMISTTGCRNEATKETHDKDTHDHGPSSPVVVTGWSSSLEAHAEILLLAANVPSRMLLFLTRLPAGKPQTGAISLTWAAENGATVTAEADDTNSPGRYSLPVNLPAAGAWTLQVRVQETGESVLIADIPVAKDKHEAEHYHRAPAPANAEIVTMTKEQQWLLGVASEEVAQSTYIHPIRVAAKVEAMPSRRVEIKATVSGRLSLLQNGNLPTLGQKVMAGQNLLTIKVPLSGDAGQLVGAEAELIQANEELQLAQTELVRANSLLEAGAASQRRVEVAVSAVAAAQARQQAASRLLDGGDPARTLSSPIDGMIVAVEASTGSYVEAGQTVLTVLDPSRVWVRGHIPENSLDHLPAQPQASLGIHGDLGQACNIQGAEFIYLAPEIDPASRTAAIVYAVDNHDGHLRPGQSLGLALNTHTTTDGLVIPVSALVDEHGRPVVFVQIDGETFVKRHLALESQDGRHGLVKSGLSRGERVVVHNPWAVKLAGTDTEGPGHGHTH